MNILGANFLLNIFSKNHVLYSDNALGFVQGTGLNDPNVDEYERRGLGIEGVAYNESTFNNQPWSMNAETEQAVSRFTAIFANQNPEDVESNESGAELVAVGGSLNLREKVDLILNQLDETRTKLVKSIGFFKSGKNKNPIEIPMTGSSSVAMSGEAMRGYAFNKPLYREGWQHNCDVTPQSTPDDTVLVGNGTAYLRRDAGDYEPRRVYFKGGSGAQHGSTTTDERYDAVVLYETGKGYNDLDIAIVEGTESVTPAKVTDSDIETAIDLLVSGAKWVRLADVLVDETTTVVINVGDIEIPTNTIFTFNKTAIEPSSKLKEDSFFLHDTVVAVYEDGELKENTIGIASDSTTALTYSIATEKLIEVVYLTQPFTYISPLK